MFLVDDFIGFVLRTIATAVDQELNDEDQLRRRLVEAQLRFEEGEIDDAELETIEREVFDRLRAMREERDQPEAFGSGARVVGADVELNEGPER